MESIVLKSLHLGHTTKMPTFAFNSRYVLLTYAQCGSLDPFDIVDHLASKNGECIIGRELHADGGNHLHVFIDFGRKFRSRSATVFDVAGFHPNISPSLGNPGAGYDYAVKDGDVVAGGLVRPGNEDATAPDSWAAIVMAETREEFYILLRRHQPRALCTSFLSLEKFAEWNFRVDPEPYQHDSTLCCDVSGYPQLGEWVSEYLRPEIVSTSGKPSQP